MTLYFRIASVVAPVFFVFASVSIGAPIETFDGPIVTGPQAPGVWYTDRYAPAGFSSPVSAGGRTGVLQHSISATDGASSRPASFSSAFYNTQGRKLDLPGGTTSMSIDLFISSDWASSAPEQRLAGFWGTAFDASDAISSYPIIEFTTDNNDPRFRGWDGLGWVDLGLPTGFTFDEWYTLGIELDGTDWEYTVGDLTLNVGANGSTYIGNTILQGHNTTDGVTYDIFWDNLASPSTAAPVPEPASLSLWALVSLTTAGLGWRQRRKKRMAEANG